MWGDKTIHLDLKILHESHKVVIVQLIELEHWAISIQNNKGSFSSTLPLYLNICWAKDAKLQNSNRIWCIHLGLI
jgi:hypothetical protein